MLDLYSRLDDQTGNLVLSEFSLHRALAMLHLGTRGNTQQQMAEVLGDDEVALPLATGSELTEANGLWIQSGLGIAAAFESQVRAEFGAAVAESNFRTEPEAARQQINAWIANATRDHIRELLQPGTIRSITRLVLANAIYFKGSWQVPFDEELTRTGEFRLADGSPVSVPFMCGHARFAAARDSGMMLAELAYEGNCRMRILIPRQWDQLDLARLPALVADLKPRNISVSLPRFEARFRFQAEPVLAGMGMTDLFSPDADLSGIVGDPAVYVSSVIHEARILVNEAGSEASAASAMQLTLGPPTPTVCADRPFLFWIQCGETTLFRGRIMDPST